MKVKIISVLITLFLGLNTSAQNFIDAKTIIDWDRATIEIDVSVKLSNKINVIPEAKIDASNKIESAVPVIIQRAMEDVILNSSLNVFERLKKDLHLTVLMDNFSNKKYNIRATLSNDLQFLNSKYRIPLYPDFCSTFIEHKKELPIDNILYYVPSQDYTGIIIYASQQLPIYGENRVGLLNPSLFPKILNDSGETVFKPTNIKPEILKRKGAVHFVQNMDEITIEEIGLLPLKIQATAIFGRNRCDIVIPTYLSDKILSRKNNIDLLHNGKIVIVCKTTKFQSEQKFQR